MIWTKKNHIWQNSSNSAMIWSEKVGRSLSIYITCKIGFDEERSVPSKDCSLLICLFAHLQISGCEWQITESLLTGQAALPTCDVRLLWKSRTSQDAVLLYLKAALCEKRKEGLLLAQVEVRQIRPWVLARYMHLSEENSLWDSNASLETQKKLCRQKLSEQR